MMVSTYPQIMSEVVKILQLAFLILVNFFSTSAFPKDGGKEKSKEFFKKGTSFYDKWDFETAEMWFRKSIKEYPKACGPYTMVGLCRIYKGDREGFKWIKMGIAHKPDYPFNYLAEGFAHYLLEEYKEALPPLLKAYNLFKQNKKLEEPNMKEDFSWTLHYLSQVYLRFGNYEKSKTYALELAKLPSVGKDLKGRAFETLGEIYYKLGDMEKSMNYLKSAEKIIPRDPYLYVLFGDLYFSLSKSLGYLSSLTNSIRALKMFDKADELIRTQRYSKKENISRRRFEENVFSNDWLRLELWINSQRSLILKRLLFHLSSTFAIILFLTFALLLITFAALLLLIRKLNKLKGALKKT
jgi:tetratricopeptide (TPR) repeat protein